LFRHKKKGGSPIASKSQCARGEVERMNRKKKKDEEETPSPTEENLGL